MKSTNNIFIRIVCLLIVFVMLLSGCTSKKPPKTDNDVTSSDITSSENVSSEDASSEDNSSSDDKATSDNKVTNTVNKENNSSVQNTDDTSSEKEDPINGKITKPDANSLTVNSAALAGANGKITNFKLLTDKIVAFELVEFDFNVPNLPSDINVYKEDELDITMKLTGSNGKSLEVDGFYFEEYSFTDDMVLDKRTDKAPSFRFRVSPQGGGTWDFTVTLKIKGQVVDTLTAYINVTPDEKNSQVLEVEPNRKQTFVTRSGKNFMAIGENISWNEPIQRKARWSQYITQQMRVTNEYGANYTRVWDYWEGGGKLRDAVNVMNQGGSAQWDKLFETADEIDFYIAFNMFNMGEFQTATFNKTCWYSGNGGYLDTRLGMYTDRKTIEAMKTYIRYVISRWGYSEHVFAWEICNEIDHGYIHPDDTGVDETNDVRAWLKELAEYIRKIDPYTHMVANSTGYPTDPIATYDIFDFVYYHYYNYESLDKVISLTKSTWLSERRPVLYGEWGVDGDFRNLVCNGENITDDLTILHHGNWMGVMGGSGGTGFSWWWEDVDEKGAQWTYQVVSEIAQEIPWNDPNMFMVNTSSADPSNDKIEATGYRGDNYAYIWFYDQQYTIKNRVETTFKNETASVRLKDGTYNVRWVNTWTGVSVKKEVLTTEDGYLNFEIPEFTKDIVVAITVD